MALASRLITITSLAASLCCFLQAVPATALSIESHAPRALHHNLHDALAKRKRSNKGKRCKPRPASSSAAPSPSPSPTKAHSSSAASPSSSPVNSGGSSTKVSNKGALAWGGSSSELVAWSAVKTFVLHSHHFFTTLICHQLVQLDPRLSQQRQESRHHLLPYALGMGPGRRLAEQHHEHLSRVCHGSQRVRTLSTHVFFLLIPLDPKLPDNPI